MAPNSNSKHRKSSSRPKNGSGNGGAADASVVLRVPKGPDALVDPILCSFPGGLPAALTQSAPEQATVPRFVIQKQGKGKKLIVGKDHACLYSAVASPTASSAQQQPTTTTSNRTHQVVIGIYDKHKQQVTLQPTAEQGFVYAMVQSVPSYQSQKDAANDKNDNDTTSGGARRMMSPAERRKALYDDFGSAKKRKVLRSQEANRVNVESVVGAGNVQAILSNMSESNRQAVAAEQRHDNDDDDNNNTNETAADQATQQWRQQFLPAFDEHASEPAGVYNVEKIAGRAVWNRLEGIIHKCLQQENVLAAIVEGPNKPSSSTTTSASATETIEQADDKKIIRRKDEWYPSVVRILKLLVPKGSAAKEQLATAMLLNYFLHLYTQLHRRRFIPSVEGQDRPRYFGVPLDVGQRWLESFTTPTTGRQGQTGYCMSKANKDRCSVHLFLLYLMAEGGKKVLSENIQPLADDLQMDVKDASHLLRLAGCTVTRKTVHQTTAVLSTPLKFPSLKKAGRRK